MVLRSSAQKKKCTEIQLFGQVKDQESEIESLEQASVLELCVKGKFSSQKEDL